MEGRSAMSGRSARGGWQIDARKLSVGGHMAGLAAAGVAIVGLLIVRGDFDINVRSGRQRRCRQRERVVVRAHDGRRNVPQGRHGGDQPRHRDRGVLDRVGRRPQCRATDGL